ncbi:unnamed protein product, partial [Prorocentrum cordatum]
MVAAADPSQRDCPRAKGTSDPPTLADLCQTHALSIIRYQAQSDVEETARLNKAAKDHSPELSNLERASRANAAEQAMQHCCKHKDARKPDPATATVARALRQHGREGAPTLPIDARPKPLAAPASSTRGPALRSFRSAIEIAVAREHNGTPRTSTKKASVAPGSPSPSPSAALTTTKRRSTRKQSLADLPTPPAAEKPAPKRASVREVDCNRMKLKETDDSGELREFDLAPGERGMRAAVLADGASRTSEITSADFAKWKNPPVNKKPGIKKTSGNNKKPASATGAWRVEGEDPTAVADEEGEGGGEREMGAADEAEGPEEDDDAERELSRAMKGTPPKPAAAKAKPAAAELKAKPAAAELPKAKPA